MRCSNKCEHSRLHALFQLFSIRRTFPHCGGRG